MLKNDFYTVHELTTLAQMSEQFDLFRQLNGSVSQPDYERMLADEMIPSGYRMVGIFDGDLCVGISGMWFGTKLYCGKYLEADNVVIDEKYRSKGVGKILFDWMEAEGKRLGCTLLMLDAYVENFPVHRFYYRQGFIARGFHYLKKLD